MTVSSPVWKGKGKFRTTIRKLLPGFPGQRNRPQMESCGLLPSPWFSWIPAICLHLPVAQGRFSCLPPSYFYLHHHPGISKYSSFHCLIACWRQALQSSFNQSSPLPDAWILTFCLEQVLLLKNTKQTPIATRKKIFGTFIWLSQQMALRNLILHLPTLQICINVIACKWSMTFGAILLKRRALSICRASFQRVRDFFFQTQ